MLIAGCCEFHRAALEPQVKEHGVEVLVDAHLCAVTDSRALRAVVRLRADAANVDVVPEL
jgi:hypothetical protein